ISLDVDVPRPVVSILTELVRWPESREYLRARRPRLAELVLLAPIDVRRRFARFDPIVLPAIFGADRDVQRPRQPDVDRPARVERAHELIERHAAAVKITLVGRNRRAERHVQAVGDEEADVIVPELGVRVPDPAGSR